MSAELHQELDLDLLASMLDELLVLGGGRFAPSAVDAVAQQLRDLDNRLSNARTVSLQEGPPQDQ